MQPAYWGPSNLMNRQFSPAYTALSPSSASILSSWLYFARRSDLQAAPITRFLLDRSGSRSSHSSGLMQEFSVKCRVTFTSESALVKVGSHSSSSRLLERQGRQPSLKPT